MREIFPGSPLTSLPATGWNFSIFHLTQIWAKLPPCTNGKNLVIPPSSRYSLKKVENLEGGKNLIILVCEKNQRYSETVPSYIFVPLRAPIYK